MAAYQNARDVRIAIFGHVCRGAQAPYWIFRQADAGRRARARPEISNRTKHTTTSANTFDHNDIRQRQRLILSDQ